jgi:uncharacterized repeat protein (TIGR01451 family)
MKLRRSFASFFLVGVVLFLCSQASAGSLYGKVIEIIAGDEIRLISLNRPVRIKLMAISAPEVSRSGGEVAKQHLLDLVGDKMVVVEYFGLGEDGSIIGRVFLNQMDVGEQMVRDGAAWFDRSRASRLSAVEVERYADSEAAARNEQRGIWQGTNQSPNLPQGVTTPATAAASNESTADLSRTGPAKSLTNEELGFDRFSQQGQRIASANQHTDGDWVASVFPKQLFKMGPVKITRLELSAKEPLPTGYDFYEGYDIRSEAIAVGHDVTFKVPSETDPTAFASLRVLHFEEDDMHPTRGRWIDRTVLGPLAPNFKSKTVNASTDQLGLFVIAKMDGVILKNAPVVDLSVDTTASPERVEPDNDVRYTIAIQNKGHYSATEVVLASVIDMRLRIISATSPHGACKRSTQSDDTVICDLNNLAPGTYAVVNIDAKLVEGGPVEVLKLNHTAIVRAKERQANSPNPEAVVSTTVRLAQ